MLFLCPTSAESLALQSHGEGTALAGGRMNPGVSRGAGPSLPLRSPSLLGGIAQMGSSLSLFLTAQGSLYACGFLPPALAGVFTRVWVSPSLSACAPALPSRRQPPCEHKPSVPIPQHTLLPFSPHLCNWDNQPAGRRGSGGRGGSAGGTHSSPPPPWCQAAAGSAPAPWSRCAMQTGQIGSACSQEGWHSTRGELQDVPLRGANGGGKRPGNTLSPSRGGSPLGWRFSWHKAAGGCFRALVVAISPPRAAQRLLGAPYHPPPPPPPPRGLVALICCESCLRCDSPGGHFSSMRRSLRSPPPFIKRETLKVKICYMKTCSRCQGNCPRPYCLRNRGALELST
ncbi:glutamate receptor ionotropic, NMDA 2D-like [Cygnus olor]|uniref:glutamate receptor ionotropic, NMDA 2D-like n=1 Tax=Cygnus olor TaxID=8869 RepID=UPI001ADE8ADF|nr:glutamate receptor ionotropic, NMDA 2D-like [Cygnus olor]